MPHHFKQHIQNNRWPYFIVSASFFIGFLIGQVQVEMLDSTTAAQIQQWFQENIFFHDKLSGTTPAASHFWLAFQQQLKSLLIIWFLGMTLVGAPLILGILFYRGISLGFTFHLLFYLHTWKGLGIFFTSVVPQNLLYLPCLLVCSVSALKFSRNLLRRKQAPARSFSSLFIQYQLSFLLFISAAAAGAFIEVWFAENIVHLIY